MSWTYYALLTIGTLSLFYGFPDFFGSIATRGAVGDFSEGLVPAIIAVVILILAFVVRSRSKQKLLPIFPSIIIPIVIAGLLYAIILISDLIFFTK